MRFTFNSEVFLGLTSSGVAMTDGFQVLNDGETVETMWPFRSPAYLNKSEVPGKINITKVKHGQK